jgi:glycosyltransferase involved in cell wall biosynthesis
MHLVWITEPVDDLPVSDPAQLLLARMASQRLRIALPGRELVAAGIAQSVISTLSASCAHAPAERAVSPEVAVFSKILPRSEAHVRTRVEYARQLLSRGARLVVDICDNPFRHVQAAGLRELIAMAHRVVANSEAMAELIETETGRDATVIADPVEGERQEPAFTPEAQVHRWFRRGSGRLRLLWFGGSPRNYASLQAWLPKLEAWCRKGVAADLTVVAAPAAEIEADLGRYRDEGEAALRLRFLPWSLPLMQTALAGCDLVLLPGDPANALKHAVSANRLIEGLQAGRFVVASAIPSYLEFRDAAWIGEPLDEGLDWALAHPQEVRSRIALGQARIDREYSPAVIGAKWHRVLTDLLH